MLATIYGFAGHTIRKQRRLGGWLGISIASLTLLMGLRTPTLTLAGLPWLLLNTGIVSLLASNWRDLRGSAS